MGEAAVQRRRDLVAPLATGAAGRELRFIGAMARQQSALAGVTAAGGVPLETGAEVQAGAGVH